MTFADLLIMLERRAALPPSRLKDCKTSLRYLAAALGQGTLEACPVEGACQDPATWTATLEAHFRALETQGRAISAATRRNTRNNCRVLFRLAEAHGLLQAPLPPRLLTKPRRKSIERQQRATAPYQTISHPQTGPRCFALPQAQWPPDIQAGWREYQTRCGLRLRETTFQKYATDLTLYLGYLANIRGRTPTWDDVFDVAQLTEFVRWHAARAGTPPQPPGVEHGVRDRRHGQCAEASGQPGAGRRTQWVEDARPPAQQTDALGIPGHPRSGRRGLSCRGPRAVSIRCAY
jgi:hypothetical protein